jgi:hypothetical protein
LFQFANVQEGAIILVARNLRSGSCRKSQAPGSVARIEVTSAEQLAKLLATGKDRASAFREILSPHDFPTPSVIKARDSKALGQLLSVGIGGVTGDAKFFLMNEEKRKSLRLPLNSVRPSVSRARHLTSPSLTTATWAKLREADERIWIFDPKPCSLQDEAVQKYIRWGRREGCDIENYKIAIRKPWYKTRLPPKADGFLSGMSKHGPWICFREMPQLTATNTLYVVEFPEGTNSDLRATIALALLTSKAQEGFTKCSRRYADGLIKYELGDLRDVNIPVVRPRHGAKAAYKGAIIALLGGEAIEAHKIADNWFFQSGT